MMAAQRQQSGAGVVLLSRLLQDLVTVAARDDVQITGVTLDSRLVTPGSLFMALSGTCTHGLEHVRDALQRGAAAVVFADDATVPPDLANAAVPAIAVPQLHARAGVIARRFFNAEDKPLCLIGVTGTDGKTSVSHLLAQILDREPTHCGLLGTLGCGRVGQLDPSGLTTPDAVSVQARLAEFTTAGIAHAVMEVSSHALAQHRTAGCRFAVAVLTNLGRDHLDYHGNEAAYAQAKARLFESPELGAAVLNLDDAFSARLREALPGTARVFGYTLRASTPAIGTTLRASRIAATAEGISIDLAEPFAGSVLRAPLLGDFNAANMLAVAATLLALDWPIVRIATALAACRPIPGRMEKVVTASPANVIVDYSHTPQSLHRALAALRPLTAGRLWCVFGAGGDRDRGKRPMMGAIAERHADVAVVTDDNPRTEDPAAIVAEILAGMREPQRALVRQPREAAIHTALQKAAAGDCILIAGKGHEPYQVIGSQTLPFDDRQVARALAQELYR